MDSWYTAILPTLLHLKTCLANSGEIDQHFIFLSGLQGYTTDKDPSVDGNRLSTLLFTLGHKFKEQACINLSGPLVAYDVDIVEE